MVQRYGHFIQQEKGTFVVQSGTMKTQTRIFIIAIVLACAQINAFAQPCAFFEDYTSDAGWTDYYYYYAVTGACLSDEQDGSLTFGGGKLNFNALDDANDTRIYFSLPTPAYEDFWTVSGEFTPTAGGASGRTGSMIVALSNGSDNPISDTYSICEFSNTDAIALMWTSDFDAAPDNIGFEIWANDNGTVTMSERLIAPYGDTYYFQWTRIAIEYMSLDVYLDATHTDLFATIPCFYLPTTITDLNTMQSGNFPGGSYLRQLTATLDNVCLRNIDVTAASITGPETICLGSENDYTITTFAGADIDWTLPAGITYTGDAAPTIHVTDWPGAGTYTLMSVINYNCFYDTAYYEVTVIDPGSGEVLEEDFCEGGSTTVDVTTTDATYLWDDGTTEGTHSYDTEGTYWVTIYIAGCEFTDTIHITEYPNPSIDLGDDMDICGDVTVEGPSGFTSYEWNTGSASANLTTSIPGNYSLTVTDENGCTAFDDITLNDACADHVVMPTVFSPNNDGINDWIGPNYSGDIKVYHLEIYNRYGQLIFETDEIAQGWNGKFENELQPIGTYVYVMQVKLNNKKREERGNITLVR